MKPFNLEEAKAGKPICDLTGALVKFIAHVPEAPEIERVVVLHPGIGVCAYGEGGSGNLYMVPIQGYIVNQHLTLLPTLEEAQAKLESYTHPGGLRIYRVEEV